MRDDEEFSLYNEADREEMTDADELDPEEEGFMQGYEEENNPSQCANCEKTLTKNFVEEVIKKERYRFCSEECANKFERKIEHI